MGYSYIDANGYLDGGPSINGLRQLKMLLKRTEAHPAFDQFIEYGYTNMLSALALECKVLAGQTKDKNIQFTLDHLSLLATKAEEIIALES
jgi:hypothetical protein